VRPVIEGWQSFLNAKRRIHRHSGSLALHVRDVHARPAWLSCIPISGPGSVTWHDGLATFTFTHFGERLKAGLRPCNCAR
jgi:hypothetical protein